MTMLDLNSEEGKAYIRHKDKLNYLADKAKQSVISTERIKELIYLMRIVIITIHTTNNVYMSLQEVIRRNPFEDDMFGETFNFYEYIVDYYSAFVTWIMYQGKKSRPHYLLGETWTASLQEKQEAIDRFIGYLRKRL